MNAFKDFLTKLKGYFQSKKVLKQSVYLPESVTLDEKESQHLVLVAIVCLCSLVFILIIWACLIHLNETTIAMGQITPKERIPVAQHLEGGIIRSTLVKNGDHVTKGQVLIELDPTVSVAELEQIQAKEISLLLDLDRLHSFAKDDGDAISLANHELVNSFFSGGEGKALNDILPEENNLLIAQRKSRQKQSEVIHAQITRSKDKIKQLKQQRHFAKNKVALLGKEEKITRDLLEDELVSQTEYLKLEREVGAAKADLARLTGEEKQAKAEYKEYQSRLSELTSGLEEATFQSLVTATSELAQVKKTIAKLEDRVKRLSITAPSDGVVKGLDLTSGAVVAPGQALLEIVSQSSDLIVETEISPQEIGYVHRGDDVSVKVLTFDFSRYGMVHGKLVKVSATTFKNDEGIPYYKGTIELDQQFLGKGSRHFELLAGMSVEADIITGDKTLMQYLLKPIHVAVSTSFRER